MLHLNGLNALKYQVFHPKPQLRYLESFLQGSEAAIKIMLKLLHHMNQLKIDRSSQSSKSISVIPRSTLVNSSSDNCVSDRETERKKLLPTLARCYQSRNVTTA
ncbi:hypothetical protein QE152_g17036 [Popillia japonica]|uniref:Uncharacterized protein n=1 Tax=Popillia japonica TaxID=7064 RepID=A0AAW1L203_POPJA